MLSSPISLQVAIPHARNFNYINIICHRGCALTLFATHSFEACSCS